MHRSLRVATRPDILYIVYAFALSSYKYIVTPELSGSMWIWVHNYTLTQICHHAHEHACLYYYSSCTALHYKFSN